MLYLYIFKDLPNGPKDESGTEMGKKWLLKGLLIAEDKLHLGSGLVLFQFPPQSLKFLVEQKVQCSF